MSKIICSKCGIECEKPSKEINRQIKNGRVDFFCGLSCAQSYNKTTTHGVISNCLWCKKEFQTTTHKRYRKCCSLDCAHKYSRSFVTDIDLIKLSNSIKNAWDRGAYDKSKRKINTEKFKRGFKIYNFICIICHNQFQRTSKNYIYKQIKTCSKECHHKLLVRNSVSNPNCGGETGYKKYQYKNIWMDSTWEVDIAKYLDEKNIKWERDRKKHMFWWTDDTGTRRRYYPDFYLPDYGLYLDPKNKYKIKLDLDKISRVLQENKIKLSWGLLEEVKKDIDNLK